MYRAFSVLAVGPFVAAALVAAGCSGSPAPDGAIAPSEDAGVDDAAPFAPLESDGAADAEAEAAPPPPPPFVPAPHPAAPTILSGGGPVLAAPTFVPVTFAGDTYRDALEKFVGAIGASTYWKQIGAEYGVGAGKAGTAAHLTEPPPATLSETDLETWFASRLDGTHAEWPKPVGGALYVLFFPASTKLTLATFGAGCQAFGGYHGAITLTDGTSVAYAALPRCAASQGLGVYDQLTYFTSHELFEAATDPYAAVAPGYSFADDDHAIWDFMPLAELGDMCVYRSDNLVRLAGSGELVQRMWSNAAAAKGGDPCIPHVNGAAYFNAAPVLTDAVTLTYDGQAAPTKGVKIPVGQSKTIDVVLFSDAPTDAWTVTAYDADAMDDPSTGALSFDFDRSTGKNGDTLKLTIHALKAGKYGGSELVLYSQLGQRVESWVGFVAN